MTVFRPSLRSCVIIPMAIKKPNFALVWKPADGYAIEKAVHAQSTCGQDPEFLMAGRAHPGTSVRAAHGCVTFQCEKDQETHRGEFDV